MCECHTIGQLTWDSIRPLESNRLIERYSNASWNLFDFEVSYSFRIPGVSGQCVGATYFRSGGETRVNRGAPSERVSRPLFPRAEDVLELLNSTKMNLALYTFAGIAGDMVSHEQLNSQFRRSGDFQNIFSREKRDSFTEHERKCRREPYKEPAFSSSVLNR